MLLPRCWLLGCTERKARLKELQRYKQKTAESIANGLMRRCDETLRMNYNLP